MEWVLASLAVAVTLGVLDGLWLGVVAKDVYRRALRPIMRDPVDRVAALGFYLLYVGAVMTLAVQPADDLVEAITRGALLGLAAYGTYDLTNRATIRPFPWSLVALDMAWGTVLTTAAATAGYVVR